VAHSELRQSRFADIYQPVKVKDSFYFAGSFRHRAVRVALGKLRGLPNVNVNAVTPNEKDGVNGKPVQTLDPYVVQMTTNEFCFVPRGDTASSRRLFDSVLAGCIPVVIADHINFPFEFKIPWESFVVRVSEATFIKNPLKAVRKIRDSLSDATRQNMRRLMLKYRDDLDYEAPGTKVLDNMLTQFHLVEWAHRTRYAYLDKLNASEQLTAKDAEALQKEELIAHESDSDVVAEAKIRREKLFREALEKIKV
jgi:hypothetical protein